MRLTFTYLPTRQTVSEEFPLAATVAVTRKDHGAMELLRLAGEREAWQLAVPDRSVSRVHAELRVEGETVSVCDASSNNGTFLRLPARAPVDLRADAPITLETGPLELLVALCVRVTIGASPAGLPAPASARVLHGPDALLGFFAEHLGPLDVDVCRGAPGGPRRPRELLALPVTHDDVLSFAWRGETRPAGESSLLAWIRQVYECFEGDDATEGGWIARSPSRRRVRLEAAKLAQTKHPILLMGPTGSGKTRLAALIHQMSPRSERAFVSRDLATIASNLLESELFGHVRGAFNGAVERRGAFAAAGGGTLFLDEVGELPLELQAKLLTALDRDGTYKPVGGDEVFPVSARIILATNRDLAHEVRAGRFRRDLYARISRCVIRLEALSDPSEVVQFARAALPEYLDMLPDADRATRDRITEAVVAAARAHVLREGAFPESFRTLDKVLFLVIHRWDPAAHVDSQWASAWREVSGEASERPPEPASARDLPEPAPDTMSVAGVCEVLAFLERVERLAGYPDYGAAVLDGRTRSAWCKQFQQAGFHATPSDLWRRRARFVDALEVFRRAHGVDDALWGTYVPQWFPRVGALLRDPQR